MNKKLLPFVIALAILGGGAYVLSLQSKAEMPAMNISITPKGGFTFNLNGEQHLIRGVCYNPIPIGSDYDFDFWSDPSKPWLTDGKLMKRMGVNAVRFYRNGKDTKAVKNVIGDLHQKYGIYSFMGHYLGYWDWPPANYSSISFQKNMTAKVLKMVKDLKDEPGIMGWILGNENNYSFDLNIRPWSNDDLDLIEDPEELWEAKARIYYSFVNSIAKEIKKIDPVHPVIMGVGEVKSLEFAAEETPDVDILGVIAYRGATFGNLFRQIKQRYDKPVLMIEYGADRWNAYTREEDQESQARFVELQWKDIERNSTARTSKGNVLGGMLFEWTDEWWKANENLAHTWDIHDQSAQWSHSSYYYDFEAAGHLNINEEWWGIVGLEPKSKSSKGHDKRKPKKAYFSLKELWSSK